MLNLVFLPATEPGDTTYGAIPDRIETAPDASVQVIHYPSMVWYNEAVRKEAIAQIRSLNLTSAILVGFSKSGLGAWNIARAIPDIISGTLIFDAPVTRARPHAWRTEPFYEDDAAWQADLPIHSIERFHSNVPRTHSLVLISGEAFHDEMSALSKALSGMTVPHVFLPRPHLKHHWQSGWIAEGLAHLEDTD